MDDINLDAVLFALSNECPLHGGNPNDCQLYKVRPHSLLERLTFIAALEKDEKVAMIKCHEDCFKKMHNELLNNEATKEL
jgi:hypothetical protein